MIRSFGDEETRKLFETGRSKRFSGFAGIAMRKLAQLDAAHTLDFLRAPPWMIVRNCRIGITCPMRASFSTAYWKACRRCR